LPGAFLLAETGLLNELSATTHWIDIDDFEKKYTKVEVIRNVKFVDQGNIITSAGIASGIEMSLHIVKRLFGGEVAEQISRRMDYR
jgi:transcriptional regulator GlxA family with amidase domain